MGHRGSTLIQQRFSLVKIKNFQKSNSKNQKLRKRGKTEMYASHKTLGFGMIKGEDA